MAVKGQAWRLQYRRHPTSRRRVPMLTPALLAAHSRTPIVVIARFWQYLRSTSLVQSLVTRVAAAVLPLGPGTRGLIVADGEAQGF